MEETVGRQKMIELTANRRTGIRTLFTDYPYLHGLVSGILSGKFGQAFADCEVDPAVAMLCDDGFVFFAGDAATTTASAMIANRCSGELLIPATEAWRMVIQQIWGDQMAIRERIAFTQPATWDRVRLRQLMSALPTDLTLKQITAPDVPRFAALAKSLVEFDPVNGEASMPSGIGFGIASDGTFIAGCAGWEAGGMMEFEVQTHTNHRRRGLGTVVAAALIDYCLTHKLIPCWDAANDMSVGLALKLGFIYTTRYRVYIVP